MKLRRTKIIATLGPSSNSPAMIERLVKAGADIVRLNFSHGVLKEHDRMIHLVREISKKMQKPIPILADLPGPKLRTGNHKFGAPVHLSDGAKVTLTTRSVLGTAEQIPVVFKHLPKYVGKGDQILLADGMLELRVLRKTKHDIFCKVISGGELGEHKGINLPGLKLNIPSITKKDREVIQYLTRVGVDYIALSFVQTADDINMARKLIAQRHKNIPIIAKIEKPQALDHIRSILQVANGVMIARGDLGVEMPAARIPVVQKELIHLCAQKSVPIITATQMLDSMVQNPRPTRAETTDVANAIWDGSDIVMLSNETAAGRFPLEAVRTMAGIIDQAESHPDFQWTAPQIDRTDSDAYTILLAATRAAQSKLHKAIVTYTQSGATAIALSKLRPEIPIIALTPDPETYQRLGLIWGVQAYPSPHGHSVNEMIRIGDEILVKRAGLRKKDRVIMVAGTSLSSGATNLMKIHQVGEALTGKKTR